MQKVALIGAYAPSLINFRGPLIQELVRRGHRVHVLAPDIGEDIRQAVRGLGASPVDVELRRASLNPFAALATIRSLRRQLTDLAPDVVIAYTINPIVWGASASKAAGVRRFVALVTGLGYSFTGGLQPKRLLSRMVAGILYRRALRKSDVVIFQNPDDKRDFERMKLLPPRTPVAIVNGSGVDTDFFLPAPQPGGLSFLMIARFLKDKGIREFGEASLRFKKEYPAARICLVGWLDESPDTITEKELQRLAAGGVEVLGQLGDVRPAIAACSVYVLPSYREGTPRSVLEAMAMARAIITTDAPGCRETVVDGLNGFLVEPRNAEALYRAMKRFADQPHLAAEMGSQSRVIAETKYDVNKVNEDVLRHAGL